MEPIRRSSFLLLTLLFALVVSGCAEHDSIGRPAEPFQGTEALSEDGERLGTVVFPTSCKASVQPDLERGLALLHHMTYVQAERVFRAAAEDDPECAIAYWGAAMTYAHPLWSDVTPDEKIVAGRELLDRAVSAGHRNEREESYIAAARGYFDGDGRGKSDRLTDFLAGWAAAHGDHPEDVEAKLFHSLALMATAPASDNPLEKRETAGAMAEEVLADFSRHPGAHHYIIHAYDSPPLAKRALRTARSYGEIAPENSHALHMTSHIFTRLGLWPESITFNIRAAEAARERLPDGMISGHHLHALDYLAYAYLQTAEDAAAQDVLHALESLEPPFQDDAATAYAFAAGPVRYALERRDWKAAANVHPGWPAVVNWDRYPHLLAISQFSRALGAARTGDFTAAQAAIDELALLEEKASALRTAYDWGIQVALQKTAAEAWLAYEQGDKARALQLMQEAAAMEASTEKSPVTPGEVLPAAELLADMLRDMGQHENAITQYEVSLGRSPNRFHSLFGAGRAAEAVGNVEAAKRYYLKLLAICPEPTGDRPELAHARAFVG